MEFLRKFGTFKVAALVSAGLVSSGLAIAPAAAADDWPNRPVTLVVPYGPGASNDLFTRALAERFSKKFNQPFVVDNRPGAGGFVGSNSVVNAAPDGYTFLENSSGIAVMGKVQKVDFDATRDLTPIAMIARSPTAVVVPGSLPIHSVTELIEYAKKNPDTTFYGTTGLGTTQHLNAELFNHLAGTKIKPVVYKSSAEGQTDLMAGRIQMMFVTVASTLGQLESGQLRLLAYTSDGATADSPKAPTIAESGVPGYEASVWWGLFGPKGLPREIQVKLNEATIEAMSDPAFIELLAKSGATPTPISADEFATQMREETVQLEEIIRAANIVFQ